MYKQIVITILAFKVLRMSLITEANISRIYIRIVYVHPLILYIYTCIYICNKKYIITCK